MATNARTRHSKLDPVSINQGVTVIHPDPDQTRKSSDDISVDIVAVPGLGASPEWTWRSKNKVDWIRDVNMLSRTIPNARIMIFEYESQWFGRGSIDQRLSNVADQLVLALFHSRSRGSMRPIVFVCHCLGGIVVEKALLAAKLRQSEYTNLFTCVVGCVFLGTPFRGTKSQSKASLLAEMAETVGLGVNSGLVKILKEGSETLRDLLDDFVIVAKEANMRLFCFFEQHESDMIRLISKSSPLTHKEIIVDEDSAKIVGYGKGALASDHFELNKFNGPKDGRYIMVSGEINTAVQKARGILKSRLNAIRQTLIDDGTYQTILDAFKVTDPAKDMDSSVRGRPSSQASWALSNETYIRWKDSDTGQILWIHGNAGKGQAVIASCIINELISQLQDESVFLAYFFCDEKDAHRRNAVDILKLFIRQVILRKRDLTESLLIDKRTGRQGDQKSQNFDEMSLSALWDSLQSMLKSPSVGKVYFLINGLDETDGESRREFLTLLRAYLDLPAEQEKSGDESVVKWIFLSRSGRPDIEKDLQTALEIDMEDKENVCHVNDAVKAEISGQVDRLAKLKSYNTALVYFIKRHIHARAEGNYIYVNLVIQELKNLDPTQSCISNVRKFLEGFPYGLTEMFEHIRRRVLAPQSEGIEHTKEIFRTLILAQRSPSIFELALIADLPVEERNDESALERYITKCGAFVTISEDDLKLVEWIDVAAKEHLEAYAKDQLSLSLNDVQHGIIALRCLDYVRSNAPQPDSQDGNEEGQEQEEPDLDGTADLKLGDEEQTTIKPNEGEGDQASNHGRQRQVDEDLNHQDQPGRQDLGALPEDEKSVQGIPSPPESPAQKDSEQNGPAASDASGEDQSSEATANPADVAPSETYQEPPAFLKYPFDYWLEHAKEAPGDLVEEFNLQDEFWSEESSSRASWWSMYREENGYGGMTGTTPLHIAALSSYSALLDYLLENGRAEEIKRADSWGFHPFYWACYSGDIYAVQRLVKAGVDVNAKRQDGNITALWAAATMGHEDITRYLLEQNAGVDIQDETLGTPLYVASENGHVTVIGQLLQAGANANLSGGLHRKPLNAAAYSGHTEIVQLLLKQDVEVDPDEDYRYGSALVAASRKGHAEIVRVLLEKGWNVNRKYKIYVSAIVAAATYGHVEVVQVLLESNVDVNSREQALESASQNGKPDVVKELLERSRFLRHEKAFLLAASYGRDDVLELLQKRGTNQEMLNTALYEATDHEHESTVSLLLKFGADPNAEGQEYGTALIAAAFDGTDGIVRILLENKADVNKPGEKYGTALQTAASYGFVDVVRSLLNHGAHINTEPTGIYGSALQAACFAGNEEIVELLLARGADVNAAGGEYGYPIIAATDEGYAEIAETLVSHGANVHVKDARDNTPLLVLAGFVLSKESMELLLDHGAELESTDEKGNTVLIATADSEDADGLKMLLERGANIHAFGSGYGTALHAAAYEGDEACCEILLNHGAEVNQLSGPWNTALQAAAAAADLDCVKMLLNAGADVHLDGGDYGSALQAAAYSGDLSCLQALLDAGADVNQVGGTYGSPLQAAASMGHLECLEPLLKGGADVNHEGGLYGSALLGSASKNGNFGCLKTLLAHGAKTVVQGEGLYGSVMQAAAVGDNINMCSTLLEHGANVHATGGKYGDALQAAALKAEEAFVRLLLEHSVEVNNFGGKYGTALQAAAYANRFDIVTLLLEHGANVQIEGGLYGNALNAAIRAGNTALLSPLLDATPRYSMLDGGLLQAVSRRQAVAVELFLKYGANVEARNGVLGSAWDALHNEIPIDENSDDEGEEDEEEDEEDKDEDEEDEENDEEEGDENDSGDEGENEDEGNEDKTTVPVEPDNDASIVNEPLEDAKTKETKILKLLDDAMTKIKQNPGINRFRSVKLKPMAQPQSDGRAWGLGINSNASIPNNVDGQQPLETYSMVTNHYQQGSSASYGHNEGQPNPARRPSAIPAGNSSSSSYQAYGSSSGQVPPIANQSIYQRPMFDHPAASEFAPNSYQQQYNNYPQASQSQPQQQASYYQPQYSNTAQTQHSRTSSIGTYQAYNNNNNSSPAPPHPQVLQPQIPPSYYPQPQPQPQQPQQQYQSYSNQTHQTPPPAATDSQSYINNNSNIDNNYQAYQSPHQTPSQFPTASANPSSSSYFPTSQPPPQPSPPSSYGYTQYHPSPPQPPPPPPNQNQNSNPYSTTSSYPTPPPAPAPTQSGFVSSSSSTPNPNPNPSGNASGEHTQAESADFARLEAKMAKFSSSVSRFWK